MEKQEVVEMMCGRQIIIGCDGLNHIEFTMNEQGDWYVLFTLVHSELPPHGGG